MKYGKTTALIIAAAGIMTLATISQAQETRQPRGDRNPVDRIATVLEEAGCPLSSDQIEQLENTEPGPNNRDAIKDILTEEQLKALAQNRPPRERAGRPHDAMKRILEEAGCPLTEEQIASMKELERGPGMREEIENILTDEQKQALETAREKARDPEAMLERFAAMLEKAGYPLSDGQIDAIRAIDTDGDVRAQMDEILTDEQKKAMQRPGPRHGGRHAPHGIAVILEEAGQPLTKEQMAEIKAAAQDPDTRVKLDEILTDAQKEVLAEARKNHPKGNGPRHPWQVLEEAGCPLTEDQRAALRDMPKGTDRREAFLSILTDEQKQALEGIDDNSDDPSVEKATAVEEEPAVLTVLKQNYPNPFNPTTSITYSLTEAGPVTIKVFNSQGQWVATLVEGYKSAGNHTVTWDATNQAAGVYMCRMTSGSTTQSHSMTLIK